MAVPLGHREMDDRELLEAMGVSQVNERADVGVLAASTQVEDAAGFRERADELGAALVEGAPELGEQDAILKLAGSDEPIEKRAPIDRARAQERSPLRVPRGLDL